MPFAFIEVLETPLQEQQEINVNIYKYLLEVIYLF